MIGCLCSLAAACWAWHRRLLRACQPTARSAVCMRFACFRMLLYYFVLCRAHTRRAVFLTRWTLRGGCCASSHVSCCGASRQRRLTCITTASRAPKECCLVSFKRGTGGRGIAFVQDLAALCIRSFVLGSGMRILSRVLISCVALTNVHALWLVQC